MLSCVSTLVVSVLTGIGAGAVGAGSAWALGMRDAGGAVVLGLRQAGPGADGVNRSRSRVVVTEACHWLRGRPRPWVKARKEHLR